MWGSGAAKKASKAFFAAYSIVYAGRFRETVSFARPFARRRARVFLPPGVRERTRNPWVFARFRRFGWYVTDI